MERIAWFSVSATKSVEPDAVMVGVGDEQPVLGCQDFAREAQGAGGFADLFQRDRRLSGIEQTALLELPEHARNDGIELFEG
jgi:hypothetical protein